MRSISTPFHCLDDAAASSHFCDNVIAPESNHLVRLVVAVTSNIAHAKRPRLHEKWLTRSRTRNRPPRGPVTVVDPYGTILEENMFAWSLAELTPYSALKPNPTATRPW